jgi:hypothetical protein
MVALPTVWDVNGYDRETERCPFEGLIKRLIAETGVSEVQARELVLMLGAE